MKTKAPLMTAKEVAYLLKRSARSVVAMADHGQLGGRRVGGAWRFPIEAIEEYLEVKSILPEGKRYDPRDTMIIWIWWKNPPHGFSKEFLECVRPFFDDEKFRAKYKDHHASFTELIKPWPRQPNSSEMRGEPSRPIGFDPKVNPKENNLRNNKSAEGGKEGTKNGPFLGPDSAEQPPKP